MVTLGLRGVAASCEVADVESRRLWGCGCAGSGFKGFRTGWGDHTGQAPPAFQVTSGNILGGTDETEPLLTSREMSGTGEIVRLGEARANSIVMLVCLFSPAVPAGRPITASVTDCTQFFFAVHRINLSLLPAKARLRSALRAKTAGQTNHVSPARRTTTRRQGGPRPHLAISLARASRRHSFNSKGNQ